MTRYKYPFLFWVALMLLLSGTAAYVLTTYSHVRVDPDSNRVTINFILPVRRENINTRVSVVPEIPNTPVSYTVKWLNNSSMILELDQKGLPEGQLLKFKIDGVPTVVPFIEKSVSGKVRQKVPVKILSAGRLEKIPTHGPVQIIFNTPVGSDDLEKSVSLPAPGKLIPFSLTYKGITCHDCSRWQYIPDLPFKSNETYRIAVKPGIHSMGGSVLGQGHEIIFTTAVKLSVSETRPANGAKGVPLYRTIQFTIEQEISTASVRVLEEREETGIPGRVEVSRGKVVFYPDSAFLPNSTYRAVLQAESKYHESLYEYELSFSTVDMDKRYWVEVKLGDKHAMTVYRGRERVRHMPASGGRPECPSPLGYLYTQDRGHSFWSHRFGEGATYWVRLAGQILVHSVPKDSRWKTKEEEHEKLGLPASHGCIRLDEKDAKWFFENIPRGTLVIIHR